jgi:hypothetical protein
MVHSDFIPANKNYETTKQKPAALMCEYFLYCPVKYLCILFWHTHADADSIPANQTI